MWSTGAARVVFLVSRVSQEQPLPVFINLQYRHSKDAQPNQAAGHSVTQGQSINWVCAKDTAIRNTSRVTYNSAKRRELECAILNLVLV